MSVIDAIDHVASCGGCANYDDARHVREPGILCDWCNHKLGVAVGWHKRNRGWEMPLEWAGAAACLRALADDGRNHNAVAAFFCALDTAEPLFLGCNFSSFTRYMHALLLHGHSFPGGIFLSGEWERARRCCNWCGHLPSPACSTQCGNVMREVVGMRRHHVSGLYPLAGGVLSVFAATRRAARAEAADVVRDIMSLDPVAYTIFAEMRCRASIGLRVPLHARFEEHLRP